MTYLITVEKGENTSNMVKVLPSMDFTCPVTYKSWIILRRILVDYGKIYKERGQMNIPIMFLFCLINLVKGYISFGEDTTFDGMAQIFINMFGALFLLPIIVYILFLGFNINNHYVIHKENLLLQKQLISNIFYLSSFYLDDISFEPVNKIYEVAIQTLRNREEKNKMIYKSTKGKLKQMLHVIDLSIEYLEFDEEYTPYKLCGVTTTKKIFVGFVSILGYIIGYAVFYKFIEKKF